MHVLPVYGGQGYGVQLSALRRGVHVVVGTPGRIMDHLDKGTLDLTELRFLVLDEADEMLNMGFAEDVETILADTPDDKQVALFSATMPGADPPAVEEVPATTRSRSPSSARPRPRRTSPSATCIVSYPQKVDALTRILEVENFEGMIVFVRTKSETETLAEKLRARGFSAAAINGDVPQAQRERTVNQLKAGKLDILVATDVAARGLDVERISHVVNYDIPTDTESYVHRIGRTGRAGRSGDAISFVTPRERYLLKHIEKATRPAARADAAAERRGRQRDPPRPLRRRDHGGAGARPSASTSSATSSRHYVREHDVPEVDVAAALAVVAAGRRRRCCSTPRPSRASRAPTSRATRRPPRARRWSRRGASRGERHRASAAALGNLATYRIAGRQAAQGRAAPDRRRHRQRGRPAPQRLRRDHDPARLLLVELPADLPDEAWEKLGNTRISGKLIELTKDHGPANRSRPPRD